MCSIERIMTADNPNWRSIACDPLDPAVERRAVSNRAERIER
jgi:hypothetical protein